MKIKYKIFNPAGNITALVIGDDYTIEERKIINDKIMEKETDVEQVGFLSNTENRLTMAGGEFCGNGARCAALYYINEKKIDNINLKINNEELRAGIDKNMKIWCEIPLEEYKITQVDENIYKIKLKGITILVISDIKQYKNLKESSKELIKYYNIDDSAVGVMFVERLEEYIKIYPIVWVKEIDTFFFENACGSGTIAVTMLESYIINNSGTYKVEQPSREFLETEIIIKDRVITSAILKGKIGVDATIKEITI